MACDGLTFLSPVLVGDEVSFYANLIGEGRTSMRIHVEAWRRARESEETEKVTAATITYVAIGDDRRPRPLPPKA